MAKLFEAAWRNKYSFYERYYDTDLKQSVQKEIKVPYEWYTESSRGLYSYILDENIKLDKRQGNAKEGRGEYGFCDPIYRNIRDTYWNSDSENGYNLKPNVWHLDIETRVGQCSNGFPVPEKAAESISLIQIYDESTQTIIMLGVREWKHREDYEQTFEYPVKYIVCKDEFDLIEKYLQIFKKLNPLIIYAWNGANFDYPYIYNRLKNLGFDTDRLSNYNCTKLTESEFQGQKEFKFSSDGHFYVDLMVIYKKFVFAPRPNYQLATIAEIELGESKVNHTEFTGFDNFYTGDYIIPKNPTEEQLNSKMYKEAIKNGITDELRELCHSAFCYYGYKDPLLIKKIDAKLNFTSLLLMISEKMGVQIGDATGTVKPWSQYISNRALLDNKILPPKKEHDQPNIVGGFVRDPLKGKQNWVLSADVNSMYPLLGMVGFNMSPETYIEKYNLPPELRDIILMYFNDQEEANRLTLDKSIWNKTTELLKEHNIALGINGAAFSKDQLGMVPEMVQEIYTTRKQDKKTMFKYQQQSVTISDILNKRVQSAN